MYLHANPWIEDQEISPKSVVREMIENALTFTGIVGRYDVGRSEGIVLRYLTDAYRALRQIVPDELMTDELRSIIAWLSALIRAVDSSLLDEWEAMSTGQTLPASDGDGTEGTELAFGAREDGTVPFSANRHAFRTAIRGALFKRAQVARIEAIADAVDQAAPGTFWLATQTLFDSEEDMDWRIVALVDVPASDEANRVALATVTVGAR